MIGRKPIQLTRLTADGNTATADGWLYAGDYIRESETYINLTLSGGFGGGTLTLNIAVDSSGTREADDSTTFTAEGAHKLEIKAGFYFRFTLASSTSPTLDICVG